MKYLKIVAVSLFVVAFLLAALAAVESNQRITDKFAAQAEESIGRPPVDRGEPVFSEEALMRCATWFVAIGLASLFVYLALRVRQNKQARRVWWDQTGRCFEKPLH